MTSLSININVLLVKAAHDDRLQREGRGVVVVVDGP